MTFVLSAMCWRRRPRANHAGKRISLFSTVNVRSQGELPRGRRRFVFPPLTKARAPAGVARSSLPLKGAAHGGPPGEAPWAAAAGSARRGGPEMGSCPDAAQRMALTLRAVYNYPPFLFPRRPRSRHLTCAGAESLPVLARPPAQRLNPLCGHGSAAGMSGEETWCERDAPPSPPAPHRHPAGHNRPPAFVTHL